LLQRHCHALALVAWAIVTITRAGSDVPTNLPTTTIVESGPYRFTRNPVDLDMFLGLIVHACHSNNLPRSRFASRQVAALTLIQPLPAPERVVRW
jgi:protein-S-isoprenylcysteine O-methyltransferase Ste14